MHSGLLIMRTHIARLILVSLFLVGPLLAEEALLLPKTFAGWQQSSKPKLAENPAEIDAAFPAVLKEYGFAASETAEYTREGRHITLKAVRFGDINGAYGAFTFYRTPAMQPETIGDNAASANQRVLIQRGDILIQATLDKVTAMSAAELRELTQSLPSTPGMDSTPPNLPSYFPKNLAEQQTGRYILGPNALTQLASPLTPDLVNFDKSPEVMLQKYSDRGVGSTMFLVRYPTPQIAAERLRAMTASLAAVPGFTAKRTGPIVAMIAGDLPMSDEKALIGSVNYEAFVTSTEPTKSVEEGNVARFLVAIITLIFLMMFVAFGLSLMFGGARVLLRRYLPARFYHPDEEEIIRLDLR